MEPARKCSIISAEGVEMIFRKSGCQSPGRSKTYITDIKTFTLKQDAITRWPGDEQSAEAGGQKSIFDPSVPPISATTGDGCRVKDFSNQVAATDIELPGKTQTGASLRERSALLPKRASDRTVCRSGRRSWNHCCESPMPCCGNRICSGDPRDFQAQTDPREIGSSESVQTGPSLAASGSFCRFDYKLRKVKKYPADSTRQCDCPTKPEYHASCAEKRNGCDAFHQQVQSTDILLSNHAQTGQLGQCSEGDVILYGDAKRQPTRPYRGQKGSDDYQLCECGRRGPASGALGQCHFGVQVEATYISYTKGIQTDICLTGPCLLARKIRNTDDCCQLSCKRAPHGGEKRTIGLWVRPLDISDCAEMQTEASLAASDVYARRREVCPGRSREGYAETVRYGRAKDIGSDCARPLVDRPRSVKVVEQCTQVKPHNISVCDSNQTN